MLLADNVGAADAADTVTLMGAGRVERSEDTGFWLSDQDLSTACCRNREDASTTDLDIFSCTNLVFLAGCLS